MMIDQNDYFVIAILVAIFFISALLKLKRSSTSNASQYVPFRALGNGQRFSKAYIENGDFSESGFEATFIVVFSREHLSFDVRGFTLLADDGSLTPRITDTWCETADRELTNEEIDMIFNYVIVHDKDFLDQLKVCKPRNLD